MQMNSINSKLHMCRQTLVSILLGFISVTGGCAGIVDEAQMQQFFGDLGNTTITVYPTYVKRMGVEAGKPTGIDGYNSGYSDADTEALADYLREEALAEVTVASEQVSFDREWPKTQWRIFKRNARAFGDYVSAQGIDTEYAMMAEYIIPQRKVWAVHAYVVSADGDVVWGLHLNEHFDEFRRVDPQIPADATRVLLGFLDHGWPRNN